MRGKCKLFKYLFRYMYVLLDYAHCFLFLCNHNAIIALDNYFNNYLATSTQVHINICEGLFLKSFFNTKKATD